MNDEKRRLWCHGPLRVFAEDDDWADKWYIAARTLMLLRPDVDRVVLPKGEKLDVVNQFAAFVAYLLGLSANQFLWTSGAGYLLDAAIEQELLPQLRSDLEGNAWLLVPYSVSEEFNAWAHQISGVSVFGDDLTWKERNASKMILHPDVSDCNGRVVLARELPNVPIARGYSCQVKEELVVAYRRLEVLGIERAIIKPAEGTTGEGIQRVNSLADIQAYTGEWSGGYVLEACLPIDRDEAGRVLAPSVQFFGSKVLGVSDQLMHDVAFAGNRFPSQLSSSLQEELCAITGAVLRLLKPQGPGGLDFLISDGKPVLIDPNLGRFTAAHLPRLFWQRWAPEQQCCSWKIVPQVSVWDFWDQLNQRDIAFVPGTSRTGVLPFCHLQGMWGMYLAFGPDQATLDRLMAEATALLA